VPKSRRKAFDSAVLLVAWNLWLQRNDRVIGHGALPAPLFVDTLQASIGQWCRAKLVVRSDLFGE
jgi:hypothetical protein